MGGRMKRYESLDILRAIAVLLVVGHHTAFRFPPSSTDPIAAIFKYSGWIGVDIFFVISGYLISRILLERKYGLAIFFKRRAYRILPIFAVAMLVYIAGTLLTGVGQSLLSRLWSPALLLNGWTISIFGYENVPYTITWSLSVEETAYFLMGICAIAGSRGVGYAIFSMIFVAFIVRILSVATGAIDLLDLYFFVPARLDAIAIGGLVALGYFKPLSRCRWASLIAAFAVAILIWAYQFVSVEDPFMPLVGYLAFSFAVAALVSSLVNRCPTAGGHTTKPFGLLRYYLVNFGQLSYFIYLFHIFVLEALSMISFRVGWEETGFWIPLCLAVVLVYILARVSWTYFEHPLILRGRNGSKDKTITAWN